MYKNNNFILAIWPSNYVHSERSFLSIQKPIHSIPKPAWCIVPEHKLTFYSIYSLAPGVSRKIPIRWATTIKGHTCVRLICMIIFLRCHLSFLGYLLPRIFSKWQLKKKLCFILVNQKKIWSPPWKKIWADATFGCYPKKISGGTLRKYQVTWHPPNHF